VRRKADMITVKQLLDEKGSTIWSTTPTASVYQALQLMAEVNVGALVVMNGDTIVGMCSERDYARKVALTGRTSRELKVADIMSTGIVTVTVRNSIEECMALMTERRIRHLPVVEDGRLLGLVSIGDIVKSIIQDQRSTIHHLEDYITGRR
jgi:CBS domain-containing protein